VLKYAAIMSKERLSSVKENFLVKGGLYFIGALVVVGVSIAVINEALALA
jgi:hypothetical protein